MLILSFAVFTIRHYRLKNIRNQTTYQIFLPDADGLIVGSPVRYMGIDVGYIDKIKIVGSDVYVKFVMHDKKYKLPRGVIATVEFAGLGGSKSLELYSPSEDSVTSKKIIEVKPPQRLGDVMVTFDMMFQKIDSIGQRFSVFATETESLYPNSDSAVDLNEIQDNMNMLDEWLDSSLKKDNVSE